jgi:hypothetical protein
MEAPVLLLHCKIIFDFIVLAVHTTGQFICNAEEFYPVKAVITHEKPKADHLQNKEAEKCSVPSKK